MKTSNPLNLVFLLKKMSNHLKFFHILTCVCNLYSHSLIFTWLWLNQNVTKPLFIFDNDPLTKGKTKKVIGLMKDKLGGETTKNLLD